MSDVFKNKTIGFASIGHNSRASDWTMTRHQSIYVGMALEDLKKAITMIFPEWDTINIEVKVDE